MYELDYTGWGQFSMESCFEHDI